MIERAETGDRRKVVVDQDTRGPAITDLLSVLALLQAPGVETLGFTVVSGAQRRDEEVAHALRLLETVGRTVVPAVPGALLPLLNSREETKRREGLYGEVVYKGAWNRDENYGPHEIPPLPEGPPSTEPADEDATYFLVRTLRERPGEVTVFELGLLTNLALACRIDPGPGYGDTLTWEEGANPGLGEREVDVLVDADLECFYERFRELMTRPTPGRHPASSDGPRRDA